MTDRLPRSERIHIMEIVFDIEKIPKKDRAIYEAMTEAEKASYEKTWTLLEEQKMRLLQKKNAAKERATREKKAIAIKERKERAHRLIERGAILEANIKDPLDFNNNEIKEIVEHTMQSHFIKSYIEEVRARHHETEVVSTDSSDSFETTFF